VPVTPCWKVEPKVGIAGSIIPDPWRSPRRGRDRRTSRRRKDCIPHVFRSLAEDVTLPVSVIYRRNFVLGVTEPPFSLEAVTDVKNIFGMLEFPRN